MESNNELKSVATRVNAYSLLFHNLIKCLTNKLHRYNIEICASEVPSFYTDTCVKPSLTLTELYPSDPEGLMKCDCRDPCIDTQYSVQVSNFRFPSANFVRMAQLPDGMIDLVHTYIDVVCKSVFRDALFGMGVPKRNQSILVLTIE